MTLLSTPHALRDRWTAGAAVACLCAAALLALEVPPRAGRLLDLRRQLAETEERSSVARTWEVEFARLRTERAQLEEEFAALAVNRPREEEASAVLSVLQGAAESAGLTLSALRPLERESESAYIRLPIEVRMQARFPAVLAFLRTLEEGSTLIRVREVYLEAVDPVASDLAAMVILDVLTLRAPTNSPSTSSLPNP